MDEKPQATRRHAAQTFIRSLDELNAVWQLEEEAAQVSQTDTPRANMPAAAAPPQQPAPGLEGDLEAALAAAVEDIEQFMAEDSGLDPLP